MTINNQPPFDYTPPTTVEGVRDQVKILISDAHHLINDNITDLFALKKSVDNNNDLTDQQKIVMFNNKFVKKAEELIPSLKIIVKKCEKIFLKAFALGVIPGNDLDQIEFTSEDLLTFLPVVPISDQFIEQHNIMVSNVKNMNSVTGSLLNTIVNLREKADNVVIANQKFLLSYNFDLL